MNQHTALNRTDLSVLLRVVGSRKGADMEGIITFEQTHHRKPPTPDQVRESVSRLIAAGMITQQGNQYLSTPEIQAAFFNEVRNCRDTIEEMDVLNRVLSNLKPQLVAND